MRYAKITAAVAASLAASAANALAPGTATTVQTVVTGSSAFQTTFKNEFANLCDTGNLGTAAPSFDQYSIAGTATYTGAVPNMQAYSCTLGALATGLVGQNAIVYYRAEGGSAYGVAPIAKNTQLYGLVVDATCTGGAHPTRTCPNLTAWNFLTETGAGGIAKYTTELGISDVEPSKFTGDNWPGGFFGSAPTKTELNLITNIKPITGQVFAAYVSSNVSATPLNLSRAAVGAILSGSVTDWSSVPLADGSGFVTSASLPIQVCNRDKGSGTRAAASFYFTNYLCVPTGSPLVVSALAVNASGGSETTCIQGAAAAGTGRIGYLGYNGPTDPASTVHVNVNGIAPSLQAAAAGYYDYWYEATFNNGAALTGSDATLANLIAARLRAASTIPAANVNALALADFNTPVVPVSAGSNPVAITTHAGNSCNITSTVF